MRAETLAIHAGYEPEETTKAVAVPIYQTVAYTFDSADHGAALFNLEEPGFRYSRIANPTVDVLEKRIAALEGGVGAIALASGQAALHYALSNVADCGGNIVSVPQIYGTTHTLFTHILTKQGITQIKSTLARQLFTKQLQELYAADTQRRDALKEDARKRYQELIDRMAAGSVQNERIEKLTAALAKRLSTHKGKLQYGYLQAPAKAIVDAIVDELARDVRVAEAYRLWFEIRTDILSTYQDSVPELPPLSKQKEFKPIKNMVIAEAAKLIEQSFTDEIIVPIETGDSAKQEAPDAESKSSPHREGQQTTATPPPPERVGETLSVAQSATRLLHHLSRVFQDNTPPRCDSGMRMDKKLRRKLREKKIAQGHRPDDHEDTMNMTM